MPTFNESEVDRLPHPSQPHHDVDERTPLLPNTSSYTSNPVAEPGNGKKALTDEQGRKRKLVGITVSLVLGTFCAGLDGTIMATLSAPIATSFQSLHLLAWLATAYLIASAAAQPLCGKLTDIYSRRTGLLVANLLFGMGNLICGLASKRWMMIFGRILAGMGGGAMNTIGSIIISDFVPSRQRGVWQGIGNICWGSGNGLGGVFGGYIHDRWDWHWAFLSQVPLTVVSLLLVYIYVKYPTDELNDENSIKKSAKSSIRRVDFLGSLSLVATLVVFLLGLNSGGIVSWSHPLILTSFGVSAALFCVFIFVEERVASEPVIPIRLIFDRIVACACLTAWFVVMLVYGLIFYIPIYFRVRGQSTAASGAALIPFSIFTAVGSLFSGAIIKKTGRYRYTYVAILFGILVATLLLCACTLRTPSWLPLVCMALVGTAFGGTLTVSMVALINAVKIEDQAVAISLMYAFRATASVVGVALASAVFQNVLRSRLWGWFGHREDGADIIRRVTDSFDEMNRLAWHDRRQVRDSYMISLTAVFVATVCLAVLGLVSALLIKEKKLYATLSREDDDADESTHTT